VVAPPAPRSALTQHPGLLFSAWGAELDARASDDESAIRASLVWFKQRMVCWIAAEVGTPLQGPSPWERQAVRRD
jgi:hypothetical protein